MKSDKSQTLALIGVALLAAAGVMFYVAFNQPRVYVNESVSYSEAAATSVASYKTTAQPDASESEAHLKSAETETKIEAETETQKQYTYPINLNTATVDELASIDGIGEVRASAIIEYREYLGGYSSVEQITEIKGIGEEIYAEVAGYLTV